MRGLAIGRAQPICRLPVDGQGEEPVRVAGLFGERLREGLLPSELDIVDFSADHAGHAGARAEGESHFRVTVVADGFAGRSRVERQRLVMAAAGDLMRDDIHALSITALTPAEWAARGRVR